MHSNVLRLGIVLHAVRQRQAGWEHDGKSKAGVTATFPRTEGAKGEALVSNYTSMLEDQVAVGVALPFEDLMAGGEEVAATANAPEKT
ncbi:hypothetical protein [Comamonas thiooxydans]|uniref:hypothetical protein n=1 Tax=Comamonas thiooxydans TaxID=363952 RepID=UPI0005558023|nr:hypothetical protein [Comamonas thiooxydans]